MLQDGEYVETVSDGSADVIEAITASGGDTNLINPPSEFFQDPKLDKLTPLTTTASGHVYGHIAPWNVNHIGLPPGTVAPRSRHNYAFFKTGVVETAEGTMQPVGQITLAGGHAPVAPGITAGKAVQHYDDTASAVADVNVGEDEHGIWVAGALRPGVGADEIRALRASAPSGDWRPINGNLELVAVCQVNVPGFPVARAMVASGEMVALVAAGASTMYQMRHQSEIDALIASMEDRITVLEDKVTGVTASAPAAEVETLETIADPNRTVVNNIFVTSPADAEKIQEVLSKKD